MSKVVTTSINVGPTVFCAETRGHEMFCDVGAKYGGSDTAMSPVEALLAALGNCLGMVIALTCRSKEIEYSGMRVEVEAELLEEEFRLDDFHVRVHMPGPVDERVRRAVEAAEPMCNIHNTLTGGAQVSVEVVE